MLSADRRRRPARRIRRATAQSRSGHEHQQARWLVSLKLSTTPYQATYLRSITTKPPEVSPMSCNMPHHGTGPKGSVFNGLWGSELTRPFQPPFAPDKLRNWKAIRLRDVSTCSPSPPSDTKRHASQLRRGTILNAAIKKHTEGCVPVPSTVATCTYAKRTYDLPGCRWTRVAVISA